MYEILFHKETAGISDVFFPLVGDRIVVYGTFPKYQHLFTLILYLRHIDTNRYQAIMNRADYFKGMPKQVIDAYETIEIKKRPWGGK